MAVVRVPQVRIPPRVALGRQEILRLSFVSSNSIAADKGI